LMKNIGYHKNIVNMIGCSTVKAPMCLLVEFMQHGDLLNFLRKRRTKVANVVIIIYSVTTNYFISVNYCYVEYFKLKYKENMVTLCVVEPLTTTFFLYYFYSCVLL